MTVSGGHTASSGSMRRIADLLRRLWRWVARVMHGQVVKRAGGPTRASRGRYRRSCGGGLGGGGYRRSPGDRVR
jgi:hypothetical protein